MRQVHLKPPKASKTLLNAITSFDTIMGEMKDVKKQIPIKTRLNKKENHNAKSMGKNR